MGARLSKTRRQVALETIRRQLQVDSGSTIRKLADVAGVSHTTARRLRAELEGYRGPSTDPISGPVLQPSRARPLGKPRGPAGVQRPSGRRGPEPSPSPPLESQSDHRSTVAQLDRLEDTVSRISTGLQRLTEEVATSARSRADSNSDDSGDRELLEEIEDSPASTEDWADMGVPGDGRLRTVRQGLASADAAEGLRGVPARPQRRDSIEEDTPVLRQGGDRSLEPDVSNEVSGPSRGPPAESQVMPGFRNPRFVDYVLEQALRVRLTEFLSPGPSACEPTNEEPGRSHENRDGDLTAGTVGSSPSSRVHDTIASVLELRTLKKLAEQGDDTRSRLEKISAEREEQVRKIKSRLETTEEETRLRISREATESRRRRELEGPSQRPQKITTSFHPIAGPIQLLGDRRKTSYPERSHRSRPSQMPAHAWGLGFETTRAPDPLAQRRWNRHLNRALPAAEIPRPHHGRPESCAGPFNLGSRRWTGTIRPSAPTQLRAPASFLGRALTIETRKAITWIADPDSLKEGRSPGIPPRVSGCVVEPGEGGAQARRATDVCFRRPIERSTDCTDYTVAPGVVLGGRWIAFRSV